MKKYKFLTGGKILAIILILISLLPLLDLFQIGLPLTHDGRDHVARIANFYKNLEEGNMVPRWAANLNWSYGHPILMFLYPLPSYSASFFHFIGFSFVDSTKIVFGLFFILSGLSMYLWAKSSFGKAAGFLTAILYMFAPYRFVDLYVRGALGEHAAFIFPPLIFYFLLKLSRKKSYLFLLGGTLSLTGLILSHNAISLMFLPLIMLYSFYLYILTKHKFNFIFSVSSLLLLGFSLSAFFWIPAFFEGKYTLRDILTKGTYVSSFVNIRDLFYGQWGYGGTGQFTVQVGIVQWIFAVLSIPVSFILAQKKNKLFIFSSTLSILFLITLFLMTSQSQFIWEKLTILQKFQFPWRLLSVAVFLTSLMGGLFLLVVPKKIKTYLTISLLILIVMLSKDYWKAKDYLHKPETFYTGIYESTTDTGESSPIWSVRFMEQRPKNYLEVIEGSAKVKTIKRTSTKHDYIVAASQTARLRENTLYFPGWFVFINDNKVNVEFQDQNNRGLITFYVPKGNHKVSILFTETKLRKMADIISIIAILVIGSIVLVSFGKRNKEQLVS